MRVDVEYFRKLIEGPRLGFEDLKKLILELKKDLSQYKINEIFGWAYVEMLRMNWENIEELNLTSPLRQCGYIATLALSVKQIDEPQPMDEEAWKNVCNKANEIYNYYALMHFPEVGDFITAERHEQGGIAMPSFLLSVCTGVLASVEQIKEDIISLYMPFSDRIEAEIGISVNEIVDICIFIESKLQNRLKEGPIKLEECRQQALNELGSGISPEIVKANTINRMTEDIAYNYTNMGIIKFKEIEAEFSKESATVFINLLSQERISQSNFDDDATLPTEDLSISLKPLANLGNGDFSLMAGNNLISAIQENLYGCLGRIKLLDKFNQGKGKYLEHQALNLFQGILGKNAKYFPSVCETSDGQNEHDLLIIYNQTIIIVECKAKRIRKNFRDIEKAFTRITDNFKSYIQEGYDQACNLEKLLLSQEETILYKRNGDVAISLKKSDFNRIEKIILTYENEGLLATRLSLLKKDLESDFPLCLNMQDLKQLSTYRKKVGLTKELFLEYLKQRKLIYDKVVNDDELDIFGFFLKEGNLNKIINTKEKIYYIPIHYSSMFDEAYSEEKFSKKPTNNQKIGRNSRCPCGSGEKYKKCCLRV